LILTVFLAISFTYLQYLGWKQLVDIGVYFGGKDSNPAGSFVYVLTGVHIGHLVLAISLLAIIGFRAFNYQVHAKNLAAIEICATFWHFLGAMWLYLFVFLLVNH
jgi:cytochrome c oxidase subunit 3